MPGGPGRIKRMVRRGRGSGHRNILLLRPVCWWDRLLRLLLLRYAWVSCLLGHAFWRQVILAQEDSVSVRCPAKRGVCILPHHFIATARGPARSSHKACVTRTPRGLGSLSNKEPICVIFLDVKQVVNGAPPDIRPFEKVSRRGRDIGIVVWVVAVAIIVITVFIDASISHRGLVLPIVESIVISLVIAAIIIAAVTLSNRVLRRAYKADETRQEAERELKVMREDEHVLLNAPVASAVLMKTDGTVLAINDTGAKILGSTPEEMVGRNMRDLLPEGEAERRERMGSAVSETGEVMTVSDAFMGREYTHHVVPIFDDQGEVARVAVFALDITEQADMTRRLRESEQKYRTQFETSVDGIVFSSLDGRILDCNEAYARMVGYEVGELIGTNSWTLTPKEWQAVDWDVIENQIIPTGRSDKYEKQYRRKDGSLVPVSLRVWADYDEEHKLAGVWGRVEDLSQQKQYEDFIRETIIRLEQANERLREIDRLKTEFVGMVSHELRAPIAAMESGFASLKVLGEAATPEEREALLGILERGTQRLGHLVNDLLDISRIESGQLKLELVEVDAADLVMRVMQQYGQRFEDKGVELSLETSNGTGGILCDARRIEQVLNNLIDNALKFTDAGEVKVKLDGAPNRFICAVSDTGPGIPTSMHEQVFEKFFTTGKPNGEQGVGLGLAISRGIIEAHGGRMWVESHAEPGATFGFEIPA
jgi:PAS domain S-box-containing protein